MKDRWRSALRRRAFERRLRDLPAQSCDDLVTLGEGYGAWSVPKSCLFESMVCWCVGAGNDISFDLTLLRSYGARVRCFDPHPVFGEMARRQADDDKAFSFHALAVAASDGPIEMTGWQDDERGSVSAAGLHAGGTTFIRPGRRLDTLAEEFGDGAIDLLKLDVEGSEYEVLESHDLAALGVRVLCVEFHHTSSIRRARRTVATLGEQGFRLVHRADPVDLTFVRDV